MSELMKVHFLSSDIRTCFFYLNDSDLQNCRPDKCGIKINFGEGHDKSTYGSISFTPISEVPNRCIGISPLFASRLDLRENEAVLVTYCDACSINTLQIIPVREEDYIILLRCKTILETYLLSQVGVVAEGQTLPLYVFSNISIDVEVGKLDSGVRFGKLEKFTEITVLHPSEKQYFIKPEEEAARKSGSHLNLMISQLNRILKRNDSSQDRFSKEERENTILKNLLNNSNNQNNLEYKIQPSFLLNNEIEKKIQNKFIIVSNYPDFNAALGPHCVKILAKVEKVKNEKPKQTKIEHSGETDVKDDTKENISVIMYVISFNNGNNMTAFCPPHIMKKLKMYVGSKIIITKIKEPSNNLVLECTKQKDFFCKEYFWESMADIRRSTKETILNNIKFNYKINTLIVGGPGSGKTFLLTDIAKEFSEEFFFCKLIRCKALRGKKIDTLLKFWNENLRECCRYEPSILILDDLHALTYVDDEEGEFNKSYSNRVVDLTSECLENFQGKYNITVIASSNDISQLSSMVATHGPRLFQNVHTILEINAAERNVLLKSILSRDSRILENSMDFDKIANSTNSYTIQDLRDLVDKAIFNCLLRNECLGDFLSMSQEDFDSALSELVPLSLRGVKLKENVGKNWEDVGGMTEPKKILTEVFSWPTRYPALLESCPLRLQRGVLLYGAPGTGKTLLAAALANHCGLNFISVKGPEVLSKYVGASEEGVRNLFLQAQKTRPCLLFFDEFDSLAPKRGHDSTGVTDRVVNQLLTQLDGVEALSGVWVLAATSRPDLIDPALLRPGRLDKMVFCGVPERADRCAILEVLSRNLPKAEDVDLSEISTKSEGYTGADLQAILYNAQMLAIKERKHELEKGAELKVDQNHLLAALAETKPSLSLAETIRYEKIYERFINSRKKNFVENYRGVQKVTLA